MFWFLKLCLQGSRRIHSLTMLTSNSNPSENLLYRWLLHTAAKTLFSLPISFALECIAELPHCTHPEFNGKKKIHVTNSHIHLPSTHVCATCWRSTALHSLLFSSYKLQVHFLPGNTQWAWCNLSPGLDPKALERRTAIWLGNSSSSNTGRKRHAWNTGKTHASRKSRGF